MPSSIKTKVERIQKDPFWNNLCDGGDKCINRNVKEMDELYYSNPKNLGKKNLYGASGNYDIHRDCIYNFHGIRFYRVIIGLTNGNDNIITHFPNANIQHKINSGDYIVFDFDRSVHQVIKEKQGLTPRILLKLHYIVCENGEYSSEYVERVKQMYIYYELVTRYFMSTGTDPETFYQFFCGLLSQYCIYTYFSYVILGLLCIVTPLIILNSKNISIYFIVFRVLLSVLCTYLLVVLFYWSRYQIFGIR
jgi:hypothetical protein